MNKIPRIFGKVAMLGLIVFLMVVSSPAAFGSCKEVATKAIVEKAAEVESLTEVFQQAFLKVGEIYRPHQCGRNVKQLILELQSKGFPLSQMKVLFLLHEKQQFAGGPILPGALRPRLSRNNDQHWDFHVVLQFDPARGRQPLILDLDSMSSPQPIKNYFTAMFPSRSSDRLEQMALRVIDAQTYLQAFEKYYQTRDPLLTLDDNYVVGDFRDLNLPGFPITSVRTYLNQL